MENVKGIKHPRSSNETSKSSGVLQHGSNAEYWNMDQKWSLVAWR